ncbi:MAG: Stp1/IreP family PP2C-type Ser/Thr phosphatase [Clostridia bacterium]|nr:Stp1/IreP family PP2C-type Ser/Thr phosphatase [Clostridia bacterium]
MKVVALTDLGLVRENNQDCFDVKILSDNTAIAVICDGMGGNKGGEIASNIAVKTIFEELVSNYKENYSLKETEYLLVKAAGLANEKIFNYSLKNPKYFGMGTTLIIVLIQGNLLHIVNVGDSRAYLIINNSINQITKDHSVVQQLLESGEITLSQARRHPNKNIITRALGISSSVDVDYFQTTINSREKIFLCTDGFSNYVDDDKILELVNNISFENLATECVTFAKNAGGEDNITVVVLEK